MEDSNGCQETEFTVPLLSGRQVPWSEIVAIQLFERMEDKPQDSRHSGDTIRAYRNINGDGTLVEDYNADDIGVKYKDDLFDMFKKYNVNSFIVIKEDGTELFVNEKFRHIVKAQLADDNMPHPAQKS